MRTSTRAAMALLLLLFAVVASGCGPTLAPTRYADVTGLLPPDTPFVLISAEDRTPRAEFDARVGEFLEAHDGNFFAEIYGDYVEQILGIDPLDVAAVRGAGLDPQGDFALFTLGIWPAALVKVSDAGELDRFIDTLTTRNAALEVSEVTLHGHDVQTLTLGSARLSYTRHGEHLFVVFHRGDVALSRLLEPVLTLNPAHALGRTRAFGIALEQLGGDYEMLLLLDSEALDEALYRRIDLDSDPLLAHLTPTRRDQYLAQNREHLRQCRDVGRYLANRVPYAILGSAYEAQEWRQRAIIQLDPVAARALKRVFKSLPVGVEELFEDAALAFALNASIPDIAEVADGEPSNIRCPNLAVFDGAAGILGQGLSKTDARSIFGAGFYGALYKFDITPAFLSTRSALLVFEATDPEAAVGGFARFFEGIGFYFEGETSDGFPSYEAFGALTITLVPFERHVAVVLGKTNINRLRAFLSRDAAPREAPATFAMMNVDGARLHAILELVITQLSAFSTINQEIADGLLQIVGNLQTSQWRAHFEGDALVVEVNSVLTSETPRAPASDDAAAAP